MLDNNDLKVLQFRDELLNLLRKYNYNIEGTIFGGINIKSKENLYLMTDKYSVQKEIIDEDDTYKYEFIIDDYIKLHFKGERPEFAGLNNVKVYAGVFTNSEYKAIIFFDNLIQEQGEAKNLKQFINSKERKEVILNDDTRYVWIKISDNSRGYRVHRAYIDRDITLEELHNLILPLCYSGKDDIEII